MKRLFHKLLAIAALAFATLTFTHPAHALVRFAYSVGFCMDAAGGQVVAGAPVMLWACHNRPNQQIWLDFGQNKPYTFDGLEYRWATLRFTDTKYCVEPSTMKVKEGRCTEVRTRNHGGNRFTLESATGKNSGKYAEESMCLQTHRDHVLTVNGTQIETGPCLWGSPGSYQQNIQAFWHVEQ